MNRIAFLESVSGIKYPEMLVNFFDHFVALKQIVEDSGKVNVVYYDDKCISFCITFINPESRNFALSTINSIGGTIIVYGRPIMIGVEVLTDSEIKINLQ